MSEEQTFRRERNGSLPRADIDHWWFRMKSKPCNDEARSAEQDFETVELGAFATPGLLFAQKPVRLTPETRLKTFDIVARVRHAGERRHPGSSSVTRIRVRKSPGKTFIRMPRPLSRL